MNLATNIYDLTQLDFLSPLFCGLVQNILELGNTLILSCGVVVDLIGNSIGSLVLNCVEVVDLIGNSIGSLVLLTTAIVLSGIFILNSKIPGKILQYAPVVAATGIITTAATNLYNTRQQNQAAAQSAQSAVQNAQAAAQASQAAAQAAQAAAQVAQDAAQKAQAAASSGQQGSSNGSSKG
jgi:type IV secretory pathway VirB6-like protein